ncbi:hypothetical protein HMPREF9970_2939 [Lachnoanaerobaculum saburreum F0468]|uniref:Uncharacterized protein n=1 Tax=Lachnoanaerobaculum saburreum F0468 TaxID=1095750 RepID=I0RAJ8_9FIRM|nr:hypothetical protein HMPREF9970_2939 [Lachnoanaerobaculum saburreum F0468]
MKNCIKSIIMSVQMTSKNTMVFVYLYIMDGCKKGGRT